MSDRNEAAERLLEYLEEQDGSVDVVIARQVDRALATERRATVEEFYDRLRVIGFSGAHLVRKAMLDEEAAR